MFHLLLFLFFCFSLNPFASSLIAGPPPPPRPQSYVPDTAPIVAAATATSATANSAAPSTATTTAATAATATKPVSTVYDFDGVHRNAHLVSLM